MATCRQSCFTTLAPPQDVRLLLRAGWPDESVKNHPKFSPSNLFSKLLRREEVAQNLGDFCHFQQKLPKENDRPKGENWRKSGRPGCERPLSWTRSLVLLAVVAALVSGLLTPTFRSIEI
jgi:hypothetical protein